MSDDMVTGLLLLGYAVGPAQARRKHWGEYAELYADPSFDLATRLEGFDSGRFDKRWVLVQPQPIQPGTRRFVGFDLDLDVEPPTERYWPAFWKRFRSTFGAPERYPMVRTPSGGQHIWVPLSEGDVPNHEFGPEFQIRGRGGLLMCPPSKGKVEGKAVEWVWMEGQSPFELPDPPAFPQSTFEEFFKPYEKQRRQDGRSAGRHDALRRDLFALFKRLSPAIPDTDSRQSPAFIEWMDRGQEVIERHEQRNGQTIEEWEGYDAERYLSDEWDRLIPKLAEIRPAAVRIVDGRIVTFDDDGNVWPLMATLDNSSIESVSRLEVHVLGQGHQPTLDMFVIHTSAGPRHLPCSEFGTSSKLGSACAQARLMPTMILPKGTTRGPVSLYLMQVLLQMSEGSVQALVPSGCYSPKAHPQLEIDSADPIVWVAPTSSPEVRLSGYPLEVVRSLFGADQVAGLRGSDQVHTTGMADWLRAILGYHVPTTAIRMAAVATYSVLRGAFRDLAHGFQPPIVWVVGPSGSAKDKGLVSELRELAGCVHAATPAVARRSMFTARHGLVMHNEVGSINRESWEELLLYASDETPMTVYGQKPGTLSATLLLVGESIPAWCSGTAFQERRFVVPTVRIQDRRSLLDPSRLQLHDFSLVAGGGQRYRAAFIAHVVEAMGQLLDAMPEGLGAYLNRTQIELFPHVATRGASIDTALHLCARLYLWLALGMPADADVLDPAWSPGIEVAPGHVIHPMSYFTPGEHEDDDADEASPWTGRTRQEDTIWDSQLVELMRLVEYERVRINAFDSAFEDPAPGEVVKHRTVRSFHLGTNPWVRPGALAEEGRKLWGDRRPYSPESLGLDITRICAAYNVNPSRRVGKPGQPSYRILPQQFADDFRARFTAGIDDIDDADPGEMF